VERGGANFAASHQFRTLGDYRKLGRMGWSQFHWLASSSCLGKGVNGCWKGLKANSGWKGLEMNGGWKGLEVNGGWKGLDVNGGWKGLEVNGGWKGVG
jgi:hypothetical protein